MANKIQAVGSYGMYVADPERVGQLASAYYGNVNGTFGVLLRITESRLGHNIDTHTYGVVDTMELIVMLASDDGMRVTADELTRWLASDEFND